VADLRQYTDVPVEHFTKTLMSKIATMCKKRLVTSLFLQYQFVVRKRELYNSELAGKTHMKSIKVN